MNNDQRADRRLRAAARRLGRVLRARATAGGARPGDPEPASEWERRAEDRLRAIEKQLNNQNRLLLLTLVSIMAEVAFKLTGR